MTVPPIVPPHVPGNNDTTEYTEKSFTYLALGDSYTIGQSVPAADNYPNKTVSLLKNYKLQGQLKIVATTGWTTDNLDAAITRGVSEGTITSKYDFVTLLIGVNDQYQGQQSAGYKPKFEKLLKEAIAFAGDNAGHVAVISIPDWSVTPFGSGKDPDKVTKEIDEYNAINKEISFKYGVTYLDITEWTREAATDTSLLASDGLHPSGKEYARWAEKLAFIIKTVLR